MTFILLILFVFCLTLTIANFQKAHVLRKYNKLICGRVRDVISTDNGVFFDVEYNIKEHQDVYKHRFSKSSMPESKMAFLVNRFVGNPFYLVAKLKDEQVIAVSAYSNAKVTRWGFLVLTVLIGCFLFPI